MKSPFIKFLILFPIIAITYSCNKNDSELTFGEKYVDSESSLLLIDTMTVEFSTVKLDSISTLNTGEILVGYQNDDNFGEITCTGFFEIETPGTLDINSLDVYDSVVLILNYSSYNGDTTQEFSLAVHQLTEKITLNDNNDLYNTSSVSYDFQDIGSKLFFPKPNTIDSLRIKISDDIGSYLFNGLKDNLEEVTVNDNFLDNFKGLVLVGDDPNNKAILGFSSDTLTLRIFSHGDFDDEVKYYDFKINTSANQFNRIEHNYTNTTFRSIESQRDAVESEDANGFCFLQAGTTLLTKVRFPYLNELLLIDRGLVMQAELVFAPEKSSYGEDDLPTDLILYTTDKYNNVNDQLYLIDGSTAVSPVVIEDDLYQENTFYSFDISTYILNGIDDGYFDVDVGLLISFNTTVLTTSFSKVLIDTREFAPQLKLYLLKY